MRRLTIATLLLLTSTSVLGDDPKAKSLPFIPSTISNEAQEYLRARYQRGVPPLDPKTLKEWRGIQESAEANGKRLGDAAMAGKATATIKKFGNVDVHIVTPNNLNKKTEDKILLHVHGGGYVMFTAGSTYQECVNLAHHTRLRVYSIDYRLAPQHPFPAALDDCVAAYRGIIKHIKPKNIGVSGISSGGSLILSMLQQAAKDKLPMPMAVASITPWADITQTGDSYHTIEGFDPILDGKNTKAAARAYAGKAKMKDPLVSPVYEKNWRGFPPTMIQTGTRDLFLSNAARLYRNMKRDGIKVELCVWEGMWHGFIVAPIPEAKQGTQEIVNFFDKHLKLKLTERKGP